MDRMVRISLFKRLCDQPTHLGIASHKADCAGNGWSKSIVVGEAHALAVWAPAVCVSPTTHDTEWGQLMVLRQFLKRNWARCDTQLG